MLSVPLLLVAPLGLQLLTLGRRVGALLRRGEGGGVPTSPDGPWHASCGAKVSQMPPELNIEHQRAPKRIQNLDVLYRCVCNFQLYSPICFICLIVYLSRPLSVFVHCEFIVGIL